MKKHETNIFIVTVDVSFPADLRGNNVLRWFNRQWTGRPAIPLNKRVSTANRAAAHALHCSRWVRLMIKVKKDGSWKLIKAELP